ncbi:MAG: hypothetical protein ACRD10_12765, partial [Terriglobia bacterium]
RRSNRRYRLNFVSAVFPFQSSPHRKAEFASTALFSGGFTSSSQSNLTEPGARTESGRRKARSAQLKSSRNLPCQRVNSHFADMKVLLRSAGQRQVDHPKAPTVNHSRESGNPIDRDQMSRQYYV